MVWGWVPAVDEVDAKEIALTGSQGGSGDPAVVGPRRELHARNDLDLLVVGKELPLAQRAPAGEAPRLTPIEVAQNEARVEAVHFRIYSRVSVCESRV